MRGRHLTVGTRVYVSLPYCGGSGWATICSVSPRRPGYSWVVFDRGSHHRFGRAIEVRNQRIWAAQ